MVDDDIQIIDSEDYYSGKEKGFSHATIIMQSLSAAIKAGSCEMRKGAVNERYNVQGDKIVQYVEDTRKKFIETVESLLSAVDCDKDDQFEKEVDGYKEKITELKDDLKQKEWVWWTSLPGNIKLNYIRNGEQCIQGYFRKDGFFYELFIDECVPIYRNILSAVSRLTKRKNYYQEETYEA